MGQYRDVGGDIAALVMSVDEEGNPVGSGGVGGSSSTYSRVMSASDRVDSYTYLEPTTSDRRLHISTYTSVEVGAEVTETITYEGSSGGYYPVGKTRVVTE